jgi:Uma2 family endonuclease
LPERIREKRSRGAGFQPANFDVNSSGPVNNGGAGCLGGKINRAIDPRETLAMSAVLAPIPRQEPQTPPFPIHRFTVAEYERMAQVGFLDEESNVEFLEGLIVPKMTKHPPHDGTIDVLIFLLQPLLPKGWFIRVQSAVVTEDSVPEPDLAIVRGRPGAFRQRHPSGSDVGLIIEVADATVRRDRLKASIYARAGIPHYWIVNLDDGQVEACSQIKGRGAKRVYQSTKVLRGDAEVKVVLDGRSVGALSVREILG